MARYYEPSDPRFLKLVRRLIARAAATGARGMTARRLATILEVEEEEAEAALIKLKDRGDLVYRRRKSR